MIDFSYWSFIIYFLFIGENVKKLMPNLSGRPSAHSSSSSLSAQIGSTGEYDRPSGNTLTRSHIPFLLNASI